MNGQLVGLSLSLCVKDIARGKVAENQVKEIISSIDAPTNADWQHVLDSYTNTYWREFPRKARAIADRLRDQGKIQQPRTQGREAHSIVNGHWIKNGKQTRF